MSVFFCASLKSDFGQGSRTPSNDRRRLLLAFGASLALAGCGKKGPLELPPPDAPPQSDSVPGVDQPGGDAQ